VRAHPLRLRPYRLGETEIVNAAYVDNDYRPANAVVELEL
jgi:hypothetical protein